MKEPKEPEPVTSIPLWDKLEVAYSRRKLAESGSAFRCRCVTGAWCATKEYKRPCELIQNHRHPLKP